MGFEGWIVFDLLKMSSLKILNGFFHAFIPKVVCGTGFPPPPKKDSKAANNENRGPIS